MNKDKYGEITNGEDTYSEIARILRGGHSVVIGWTDQGYTHLDILFSFHPIQEESNYLQRGLNSRDLFVSIMSIGAFGFDTNNSDKSEGYISEKLNIHGEPTITKLTELINNIIERL